MSLAALPEPERRRAYDLLDEQRQVWSLFRQGVEAGRVDPCAGGFFRVARGGVSIALNYRSREVAILAARNVVTMIEQEIDGIDFPTVGRRRK